MREAFAFSAAKTPIGRVSWGAYNNADGVALAAHAIKAAVQRFGVDPAELGAVTVCIGGGMGAAGLFEIY